MLENLHPSLRRASELLDSSPEPQDRLAHVRLAGSLFELQGGSTASLYSVASALLVGAQQDGECVAWVGGAGRKPLLRDMERGGVDVGAILFTHAVDWRAGLDAAELIVASGAVGLVVLDLGVGAKISAARVKRLMNQARRNRVAVCFLVSKSALGSWASLRLVIERRVNDDGTHRLDLELVRDRRDPRPWRREVALWTDRFTRVERGRRRCA